MLSLIANRMRKKVAIDCKLYFQKCFHKIVEPQIGLERVIVKSNF